MKFAPGQGCDYLMMPGSKLPRAGSVARVDLPCLVTVRAARLLAVVLPQAAAEVARGGPPPRHGRRPEGGVGGRVRHGGDAWPQHRVIQHT